MYTDLLWVIGVDILFENEYKEVFFNEYCDKCEFKDVDQGENPCNECLDNPSNLYSHKPVNFKEAR